MTYGHTQMSSLLCLMKIGRKFQCKTPFLHRLKMSPLRHLPRTSCLSYKVQFHHHHNLAGVWRRADAPLPGPGNRTGFTEFPGGRRRAGAWIRVHSRLGARMGNALAVAIDAWHGLVEPTAAASGRPSPRAGRALVPFYRRAPMESWACDPV